MIRVVKQGRGGISAAVIEDSVVDGVRLTTLQLRYPRMLHAEFMTHRVFSRNASSSRAIPVAKMLDQVRNDPAMPIHWGANQPGMQAHEQCNAIVNISDGYGRNRDWAATREEAWRRAALNAADIAEALSEAGYHKQVANRILEPFQFISVIVTATEWSNFFALRNHPDAYPEIQELARTMLSAMDESSPRPVEAGTPDNVWSWHLPYITTDERLCYADQPVLLAAMSAARCARVSYLTHDGQLPSIEKDLGLFMRLVESDPIHASPTEHQAFAPIVIDRNDYWSGNFRGWSQFRKTHVENRLAQSLIARETIVTG